MNYQNPNPFTPKDFSRTNLYSKSKSITISMVELMEVELLKVKIVEKQILSDLLDKYLAELSKHKDLKRPYKYLDNYFSESNRHPFFIKVDRKIAGLALVNLQDPLSDGNKQAISEFYVIPRYRNKGVGKTATCKIFDMFRGEWIIRELEKNPVAIFWKKVVEEYTGGNYQEFEQNDKKWKGKVQIFNNSI